MPQVDDMVNLASYGGFLMQWPWRDDSQTLIWLPQSCPPWQMEMKCIIKPEPCLWFYDCLKKNGWQTGIQTLRRRIKNRRWASCRCAQLLVSVRDHIWARWVVAMVCGCLCVHAGFATWVDGVSCICICKFHVWYWYNLIHILSHAL